MPSGADSCTASSGSTRPAFCGGVGATRASSRTVIPADCSDARINDAAYSAWCGTRRRKTMPPPSADTRPATSIWMRDPFTDRRTVTRERRFAFVTAPLWIANDGSAGVVITSAGAPGSAPGRTRISISPWFTTSGTRGDSLPGGVSSVASTGSSSRALGVGDRLVGADAARIGHDRARRCVRTPRRASAPAIASRSPLRNVGSPLPRR